MQSQELCNCEHLNDVSTRQNDKAPNDGQYKLNKTDNFIEESGVEENGELVNETIINKLRNGYETVSKNLNNLRSQVKPITSQTKLHVCCKHGFELHR